MNIELRIGEVIIWKHCSTSASMIDNALRLRSALNSQQEIVESKMRD
ncbi:MAG: hypothetical protein AB8B56_14970 [Crocinitomicaceae bacterium]